MFPPNEAEYDESRDSSMHVPLKKAAQVQCLNDGLISS